MTEVFKKKTAWAIGIVIAALLSFLATNVIPSATSQFVGKLRDSPAILVSENVYHANGMTAPFPAVLTGNYHPSSPLVRALAAPMGATSASYLRLEQAKGISVQDMLIHLLVTGNSGEPVRILNVEPSALHRAAPIGGVLFDIGAQGEADNIQMGFDFDKAAPQAMELTDAGVFTDRPYFLAHSISLNKGEQSVLSVEAYTGCYGVTFDLTIDYAVGNSHYTKIVTNQGHPFVITARSVNARSYSEVFTLQNNYSALPLGPAGIKDYFAGVRLDHSTCP